MSNFLLPHHHSDGNKVNLLHEQLEKAQDFRIVADLFRQLSDPSRVRIFWLLCHCEECVLDISTLMDMSSPAVSHHLQKLRSAHLITSRREGKEVYYRAAETAQAQLLHTVIEETMEIACP